MAHWYTGAGCDHESMLHRNALSASYWFQSAGQTTDDYATRIWADLTLQRARWVLVSILFDDACDPGDVQCMARARAT